MHNSLLSVKKLINGLEPTSPKCFPPCSPPFSLWSPTGKARGTTINYPPTPLGAEARFGAQAPRLRRAIRLQRNPPKHDRLIAEMVYRALTHSSTAKARACTPKCHLRFSFFIKVSARRRGFLRRRINHALIEKIEMDSFFLPT
jgi:hypothetical protein